MKKETIELERNPDHIPGWVSWGGNVWDDTAILNKIVEWSAGKNVSIYKHIKRIVEELQEGMKKHKTGPVLGPFTEKEFRDCHQVTYLDIYYQEKEGVN